MRKIAVLLILFIISGLRLRAQETEHPREIELPFSIYVTAYESEYAAFYNNFKRQMNSFNFRFLQFDEDRLSANLSNTLYFNAFKQKPTKYYLDTYKKIYDLKGQRATFFNVEKLYEVPPRHNQMKRHK